MAAPNAAGRLFAHLFRTYFGEFNMDYGRRTLDRPNLQPVVPLLLWQIRARAREWTSVEDLARLILPPRREGAGPDEAGSSWPDDTIHLQWKILEPLKGFGLLEDRHTGAADRRGSDPKDTQVRTTSLLERFLRFDWT